LSNSTKTDTEIVALLKEGSNEGYEALYNQYGKTLYGIINRILMLDDISSQDVLQDTFVKIWKNISQYKEDKGTFYTWIFNIAKNQSFDYIKSKSYTNQLKNQSIDDFIHEAENNENAYIKSELIGLNKIIQILKKDQRELIDMVYFKGYTQEEAAKNLNIPSGTVKTRIRAALIHLRNYLKSDIRT
jgi:RNA polymerase sigma-70 factor (ECF subfamily)